MIQTIWAIHLNSIDVHRCHKSKDLILPNFVDPNVREIQEIA